MLKLGFQKNWKRTVFLTVCIFLAISRCMHDSQSEWLHRSPADYRHTLLSSAISFCKACHLLHAVELLYNDHLGDRRKWPLLRGSRLEKLKREWMYRRSAKTNGRCGEVAVRGGSTVFYVWCFENVITHSKTQLRLQHLITSTLVLTHIWYEYKSMELLVPM